MEGVGDVSDIGAIGGTDGINGIKDVTRWWIILGTKFIPIRCVSSLTIITRRLSYCPGQFGSLLSYL